MRRSIAFLATLALCGCSTGFDRGAIRHRLATEPLQVTDADIKSALELKPQLRFPFKLGVYLQAESRGPSYTYPSGIRSGEWYWTEADKGQILSWRKPLMKDAIVSDMFLISDLTAPGTDLKSVRLAAARHGADAVLVIRGASQVDRYANPLSFLYITLVGMWVAPGTKIDGLMMIEGALWDVANGYLYATSESEGEAKRTGPVMVLEEKPVLEQARKKALEDFGIEFVRRLESLHGI